MGQKIIAKRATIGDVVAGILDGDFLKDWETPKGQPRVWQSRDGISFGWRWERKEIENYLIDPAIVVRSLGEEAPDRNQFRLALELARDRIAEYQAARTALSANRKQFKDLPSCFGQKRGKEQHPFPDDLDEQQCQAGILTTISNHQRSQQVQEAEVLDSFQRLLPECRPQGIRYKDFLFAFAGKDLFCAMDGWFKTNGFHGAWAFREKVMSGIRRTSEDISTWVPEWAQLHQLISR